MDPVTVRLGRKDHAPDLFAADQTERRPQPFLVVRDHALLPVLGDRQCADAIVGCSVDQRIHFEEIDRLRQLGSRPFTAHGKPDPLHTLGDQLESIDRVGVAQGRGRPRDTDVKLNRQALVAEFQGQQATTGNVVEPRGAHSYDVGIAH